MPTIRSTWRRRSLPIVVLAGFLLGLVATAAAADPPSASGAVTRSNEPIGFFYEGDGFVLVGGPPFEEGCLGEGFLEPLISFVARGDGTTLARFQTDGEQIRIYEGDSFFEDVLFPSCDAIFDEDPATVPAQPIAIGSGRMSSRVRTEVTAPSALPTGSTARLSTRRELDGTYEATSGSPSPNPGSMCRPTTSTSSRRAGVEIAARTRSAFVGNGRSSAVSEDGPDSRRNGRGDGSIRAAVGEAVGSSTAR